MDEFGTIDGGRLAGGPDIAPEDEERADRERDDDAAERTAGEEWWVIADDMASGDPDRRPADSSDDSFPAGDPPTGGSDPASTR